MMTMKEQEDDEDEVQNYDDADAEEENNPAICPKWSPGAVDDGADDDDGDERAEKLQQCQNGHAGKGHFKAGVLLDEGGDMKLHILIFT